MKLVNKITSRLILFALLTIALNISIYAQTEEDVKLPEVFPTEDAVWVIEVETQAERSWANPETGLWYDIYYTYYTYYLEGDTIMNEKKYSKLYVKDIQNNIDYGYIGGIRIEGEKVYIDPVDFDKNTLDMITGGYSHIFEGEGVFNEFCLYDFSLDKMEEFITGSFIDGIGAPYCTPMEMYNWGDNNIQQDWIKGIGSRAGLWYDRSTTTTGIGSHTHTQYTLKSFHYKGKQFYPAEESGINESIADTPKTKAYVSNGVLNIENIEGITSVVVYDIMGRVINSVNANGATSTQITLPSTIKGMIMVKVNSEVIKVAI